MKVIGYIHNPACPECNGLAGKKRLVMKAISWKPDFNGDTAGRHQGYTNEVLHCRRCAVYAPED